MFKRANNVRTVTMCFVPLGLTMARTKAWMATIKVDWLRLVSERTKIMADATNDTKLVKELENVLTIDGRGRPKKAVLLLELIQEFGIDKVLEEVKRFGERKFF
jgi:hypothetical protein